MATVHFLLFLLSISGHLQLKSIFNCMNQGRLSSLPHCIAWKRHALEGSSEASRGSLRIGTDMVNKPHQSIADPSKYLYSSIPVSSGI